MSALPDTGLLIAGAYHRIPGLTITSPHPSSPKWVGLSARDYAVRRSSWIRQITAHTTKGKHPQVIRSGSGPGDRDRIVADFWRGDPEHSAAQVVVDNDGSIVCLCDLALHAAYHATSVNDWSVGIEMYQEADGSIFRAVFDAMEIFVPALCKILRIPFQVPIRTYNGSIIRRMIEGGPDMAGVFGHRDNAWDRVKRTSTRGRGDPGDHFYERMIAVGAEAYDYDGYADIRAGKARQRYLNAEHGAGLSVDGLIGAKSFAAAERAGFADWRAVPFAS